MSVMLFFLEGVRRSLPWSSGGAGCIEHRCLMHSAPLVCTAGQEGAELAMAVSYPFLRAMKLHASVLFRSIDPLPGQAMSCSASPIKRSSMSAHSSTDIRASLRDCWAQLLLCVCDAGFQGTANCVLETSTLSLLKHLSRARWSVARQ